LVYVTETPVFKPPTPVAVAVHGVNGEPVKTTLAGQTTTVRDVAWKMV